MTNRKQVARLMAILGLLGVVMSISAQSPASTSDADQIAGLMRSLGDHSKSPSDVLDPNLNPDERDKNLHHFSTSQYELSMTPTSGIPAITGDAVSVPVRVHFDAKDGNTLDANSTAQFIKRNGTWYFSNFAFLSWPAFLIVVLVVGLLVGIGYAAVVVVLMLRLFKHGPLGVNGIKMFFPIFWPQLFRQTR
jgi:Flp pilus assembly protein TadB